MQCSPNVASDEYGHLSVSYYQHVAAEAAYH